MFYFQVKSNQSGEEEPTHNKSSPLIRTTKRLPFDTWFRLAPLLPISKQCLEGGVAFPQRFSPRLVNVSSREVFSPLASLVPELERLNSR